MVGVSGVVLFGSQARGDNDQNSDRDICVFCPSVESSERPMLTVEFGEKYGATPDSVSIFAEDVANQMASLGSLFLWHLKLEGKILEDPRGYVAVLFELLQPYTAYSRDLNIYENVLRDVSTSESPLNEADGHALFAVCRNACMLLSVWGGRPGFGRHSAFRCATELFPELPLDHDSYDALCVLHLAYARGVPVGCNCLFPEGEQALLNRITSLLQFCREKIGE